MSPVTDRGKGRGCGWERSNLQGKQKSTIILRMIHCVGRNVLCTEDRSEQYLLMS
jgi:hypothetical protein